MKHTRRLLTALLTFIIGVVSASIWSAHLRQSISSPRVFVWRNPLREPPRINIAFDSPLAISNPRYYSSMALGSGVGGELRFAITNRSNKTIHSYQCRYSSPVPVGNGGYGSQPEAGLLPGQSNEDSISTHEYAPLTLTIDFVQFADGTTWFSGSPYANVKPEGFRLGERVAALYLLQLMSSHGVKAVMETLPRIHAEVRSPDRGLLNQESGVFSFSCGVTNTALRVKQAYGESGVTGVETFFDLVKN